jgi:molybdopterin synthase sulfur carrier subunit
VIRILLPVHLRSLANVNREVTVEVEGAPTLGSTLDALERSYPVLCGTIRDHITKERRPFIRFFACGEDISHEGWDYPLPASVVEGKEPLRVVGAMAGG